MNRDIMIADRSALIAIYRGHKARLETLSHRKDSSTYRLVQNAMWVTRDRINDLDRNVKIK